MQAKKVLVRAHIFPTPLVSQKAKYQPYKGEAHLLITKDIV